MASRSQRASRWLLWPRPSPGPRHGSSSPASCSGLQYRYTLATDTSAENLLQALGHRLQEWPQPSYFCDSCHVWAVPAGQPQLSTPLGTPASSLPGGFPTGPEPGLEGANPDKVKSSPRSRTPQVPSTALLPHCRGSQPACLPLCGFPRHRLDGGCHHSVPQELPQAQTCDCTRALGSPRSLHMEVIPTERWEPQGPKSACCKPFISLSSSMADSLDLWPHCTPGTVVEARGPILSSPPRRQAL